MLHVHALTPCRLAEQHPMPDLLHCSTNSLPVKKNANTPHITNKLSNINPQAQFKVTQNKEILVLAVARTSRLQLMEQKTALARSTTAPWKSGQGQSQSLRSRKAL